MRMFVAVAVPDSVKQHARMIRNQLGHSQPDVKWVEYENYHLTVKFLGEVTGSELPALNKQLSLAGESAPPFHLSAGGLGYFPNSRRPRVLWLGIKGELDKAAFLGERVDAYLGELGYEPEKEHRFHLTLGRIRSEKNLKEMQKSIELLTARDKLVGFKVDQFQLMMSEIGKSGPRYLEMGSFYLKG
ncbi:MAG: RNA 2',3'-cyclic phosphodiesterase [Syntrophomonas sp.]|nr:RNA 2',3'-cyclic phosphodiesterase [Syntrophomonas sp.]